MLSFPTNVYRQEFMMRRLYKCSNATWILLCINFVEGYMSLGLYITTSKYLTLQILDFKTMPMSQLVILDFSLSLEERNVENFQHITTLKYSLKAT